MKTNPKLTRHSLRLQDEESGRLLLFLVSSRAGLSLKMKSYAPTKVEALMLNGRQLGRVTRTSTIWKCLHVLQVLSLNVQSCSQDRHQSVCFKAQT